MKLFDAMIAIIDHLLKFSFEIQVSFQILNKITFRYE